VVCLVAPAQLSLQEISAHLFSLVSSQQHPPVVPLLVAEQLTEPHITPHFQFHGPVPVGSVAVPLLQRLAVGLLANGPEEPHSQNARVVLLLQQTAPDLEAPLAQTLS
jgi:hypothetical protein